MSELAERRRQLEAELARLADEEAAAAAELAHDVAEVESELPPPAPSDQTQGLTVKSPGKVK